MLINSDSASKWRPSFFPGSGLIGAPGGGGERPGLAGRKLSIAGGMAPLWRPPVRDADGWRWGADRERTRMTASTNHRQKGRNGVSVEEEEEEEEEEEDSFCGNDATLGWTVFGFDTDRLVCYYNIVSAVRQCSNQLKL